MSSAKILIVEDEIITAMAMQNDLETLGYQVISIEPENVAVIIYTSGTTR